MSSVHCTIVCTEPLELVVVSVHAVTVEVIPFALVVLMVKTSDGVLVENHGLLEEMNSTTVAVLVEDSIIPLELVQ